MPWMELSRLPVGLVRAAKVAVVHVLLILIVLLTSPLFLGLAFKPASYSRVTLRLLGELRMWSCSVVSGSDQKR